MSQNSTSQMQQLASNWRSKLAHVKAVVWRPVKYFISDKHQLIYIRIPKAASTFLAYEMMKSDDTSLPQKNSDATINKLAPSYTYHTIPKSKQHYKKFTAVRNPFHRLVAVYREFFHPDTPDFLFQYYLFGVLKKEMSFSNFVNTITQIPDFLKEQHFKPQHLFLKKQKSEIKVFKLEDNPDVLKHWLATTELQVPQQEEHSKRYDYRTYYNLQTAYKVYTIYKKDIHDLGYTEEWNDLKAHLKRNPAVT